MEKMPSASNSPVMGRKSSNVESEATEGPKVKKVPLSVASMVRRFETQKDKTRGGVSVTAELMERSGDLKLSAKESLSSSSSPSSSQGHLNTTAEIHEKASETSEAESEGGRSRTNQKVSKNNSFKMICQLSSSKVFEMGFLDWFLTL